MKSGIRNLLLASVFLFAVSYDCCTSGVDYDNRYKFYPEYDSYSCTFGKVYGKRWLRFGSVAFYVGAALLITAGAVAWHRAEENANKSLSILIREE